MAFTNPILAGEELNRTGIRSENYVPGASGWRIANNGAAEFDNVGIRGNLWVPSITLNGQDLETRLNKFAKGLVTFIRGYPVNSTTSEVQLLVTEFTTEPGRQYEMMATNISNDLAGTKNCELILRYSQGTGSFPFPDNGSPIVASSGRLDQYDIGTIRAYHESTGIYTLRLRISLYAYSGTIRSYCPGGGGHLGVYDVGPSKTMSGTVGPGAPTRVLKEWTITANSSRSYNGNGTLRTDGFATTLVQGDWANGLGNQRAWFAFSNSDVSTYIDDLIGVPQTDVVTAEVRLAPFQYWNDLVNSGYCALGFHNTVGPIGAGNEPSGGIPNVHRPTIIGTNPVWIDINSNHSGIPTNFLDSMRDGYLNGFMVGNTFSGGNYAVVYQGTGGWSYYPQLHMKYWKNV